MATHIIKYEYRDGEKLDVPELWCGGKTLSFAWYFRDAQHAALSVGGSVSPCKNCIKVIIKTLEGEGNEHV